MVSVLWLFGRGVGVWGVQMPVPWGLAITNYVWWIGMGHAGTLISALLLLINQGWRNSLNRFVLMAAMYPILHLGRPWLFYWLLPYPNTMEVWPQFKSPLVWDVFAVGAYLIVSVIFWYVGLIPDLASVRDRAERRIAQVFYGLLALGWRGSARHWQRWQVSYWICAGLAVPLVVSVHSGVSLLFAVGIEPGWHSTIFPVYFVLGAIFEGFAVLGQIDLRAPLLYALGFIALFVVGMPRRYHEYPADFQILHLLSSAGTAVLAAGYLLPLGYLLWSLRYGERAGSNPWAAAGLEWTVSSPPRTHNFVEISKVDLEAYAYPVRASRS
jgi:hypothetical protein